MATTYTAFCQQANGQGTIWIGTVDAANEHKAIECAKIACSVDWENVAIEDIHVLGLAEGDVKIVHWEDLED